MRIAATVMLAAVLAAAAPAHAGAKDESIADWLPIPKEIADLRAALDARGFTFGIVYVGDTIGNVTGGTRRAAIHQVRFDFEGDLDLEKALGWSGLRAHANVYAIYGHGLSHTSLLNLATISEIEAQPETRLYEAYLEQSFWGGKLLVRAGQQAADVEFFDSETDDLFINGTFGWPAIKASDLPAGGPAPPIAVPGVRVKALPTDDITVFAAIFNGDPAAPGPGDPQLRDKHGLAFRVNDAPWLIGQVRYGYSLMTGGGALPGNITPGAWYHTGDFDDQRFTAEGLSLADPAGSGIARKLHGNFGLFGVIEQTLYRPASVTEKGVSASVPGVTAFARAAYSPPDRNQIDFYADAGIGFVGFVPGRPADRFGAGVAYMHISNDARQLDLDARGFSGLPTPVRSAETLIELIYEAHVKPGWLLQPYFQYVFRPSGGIPNPEDPSGIARIGDAAIFGLTTTIKY
ncbi:MAG TPA: carbohydrate porin [Xanthobacteraceae bacterium]|nr:carbohydrate porin [Xanthobacteraceae bacterium]